jgi:hypothetical protein
MPPGQPGTPPGQPVTHVAHHLSGFPGNHTNQSIKLIAKTISQCTFFALILSLVGSGAITLKTGMEEGAGIDHSISFFVCGIISLDYRSLELKHSPLDQKDQNCPRIHLQIPLHHANNTKEVKKLDDHDLPSPLSTSRRWSCHRPFIGKCYKY